MRAAVNTNTRQDIEFVRSNFQHGSLYKLANPERFGQIEDRIGGTMVDGVERGVSEFGNMGIKIIDHTDGKTTSIFRYKLDESKVELGNIRASYNRIHQLGKEHCLATGREVTVHDPVCDFSGKKVLAWVSF